MSVVFCYVNRLRSFFLDFLYFKHSSQYKAKKFRVVYYYKFHNAYLRLDKMRALQARLKPPHISSGLFSASEQTTVSPLPTLRETMQSPFRRRTILSALPQKQKHILDYSSFRHTFQSPPIPFRFITLYTNYEKV